MFAAIGPVDAVNIEYFRKHAVIPWSEETGAGKILCTIDITTQFHSRTRVSPFLPAPALAPTLRSGYGCETKL